MSERQLHELDRRAVMAFREGFAVRSCEMEVRSEPQHRMEVKLQTGILAWVSRPALATPNIRLWPGCSGDGSGGKSLCLTPGDLERFHLRPYKAVDTLCEGNDKERMSIEKSDHLMVAMKPGNAGGAKGVTS